MEGSILKQKTEARIKKGSKENFKGEHSSTQGSFTPGSPTHPAPEIRGL